MRKLFKNSVVLSVISMMFTLLTTPEFSFLVSAEEKTVVLNGNLYEFDKKSEYQIESSIPVKITDTTDTLGSISINGEIAREYTKDEFPAYEIADDSVFSLSYKYDNSLMNADAEEWHLTDDNKKTVNGIELEDKIGKGAVILQTSLDGKKWVTGNMVTNLSGDVTFDENNGINDIQLINGCYYRVIVAFETEKTDAGYFDIKDLKNTKIGSSEYKKYAELYSFYASYKDIENEVTGKNFNYTTRDYTIGTKKNNYSDKEIKTIDSKDPHYGWDLGSFCLSGYTDTGNTDDIYLKTVGNKVKLTFQLDQDINQLNGNTDLRIADDKNGSDEQFQTKPHNMGHGELIVKYIDEEGKKRITEYSNYLEALSSPGADTTIQLFEEGDYEVHLDYGITQKNVIETTTYYRMSFSFKIRNGNCMVYIFDSDSGTELGNGVTTVNGFRIDAAKSKYTKFTIRKDILNNTQSGLIEDTRFNRVATDGEAFTEEGIYTIKAISKSDDKIEPVEKTIYVGNNNILTAYTKHLNDENPYTISALNNLVNEGYTITADGEIIEPTTEEITDAPSETEETLLSVTEQSIETTAAEEEPEQKNSVVPIVGGSIGGIALIGIIAVVIKKKNS